jgi:hypothetical protein
MPLTHYSKFSMFTLQIWVFKSGVLKNVFILSKHGTKANIRSTKMAWSSMSVCQQWTFNDSLWLKSRWFQTVSNCSCWQTSIGQPVLFEYGTGCEWHPSNQTLQYPVVRLVRKHTQNNNVKDLPRSGRPWVTSDRDERELQRLFTPDLNTQIRSVNILYFE